jgi:hypothetical protein
MLPDAGNWIIMLLYSCNNWKFKVSSLVGIEEECQPWQKAGLVNIHAKVVYTNGSAPIQKSNSKPHIIVVHNLCVATHSGLRVAKFLKFAATTSQVNCIVVSCISIYLFIHLFAYLFVVYLTKIGSSSNYIAWNDRMINEFERIRKEPIVHLHKMLSVSALLRPVSGLQRTARALQVRTVWMQSAIAEACSSADIRNGKRCKYISRHPFFSSVPVISTSERPFSILHRR